MKAWGSQEDFENSVKFDWQQVAFAAEQKIRY